MCGGGLGCVAWLPSSWPAGRSGLRYGERFSPRPPSGVSIRRERRLPGRALISDNGTLAAKFEYSPFGRTLAATGPAADTCPFGFSTKYADAETGMLCFGYRYHLPSLGRWLSRDPIGNADGPQLYCYVRNLPTSAIDLYGQACRVFYTCYHVGEYKSGMFKHCEYVCGEDTTKGRMDVVNEGLNCEDPRIPSTMTDGGTTCRCCECQKSYSTSKRWDDHPYTPTKCSRKDCRKKAKDTCERWKKGCDLLPDPLGKACSAAVAIECTTMYLMCDACQDE